MTVTRSPSNFLIEKYKAAGYVEIHPASGIRFIKTFLDEMPNDWQNLERESLIKKVRHHCELSAATGTLKRKRCKGFSGYTYQIVS